MPVMFVCRGRTVTLDGTSYGPGSQVTISAEDCRLLTERGFLQDTPPILPIPEPVSNPANVGVQNPNVHAEGQRYSR